MAEPTVLDLILDGQKESTRKLDELVVTTTELKTKVESWDKQQENAQDAHQRCREEQDDRWDRHATVHETLEDRLKPIEDKHLEEEGSSKGRSSIWRIIAAVLSAGYVVLSAIAIFNHW